MGVGTGWKDPTRYMSLGLIGTEDLWGSGQTVDQDYLDSEARVRQIMSQSPERIRSYGPEWLKNRQGQIAQEQANLLDENAGQAAANARSSWDRMAQTGGVGAGGESARMSYQFGNQAALGRQGVLNQGAQQNLQAHLDDYNLRAQDIEQQNAFNQNKWQALANMEAGLGVGKQQAKRSSGGAFGSGGLFGTGMFA